MAKVRQLNAPNLKNPYQGWNMFANSLSDTSNNILNRAERQEARAENNAYKNKVFDNTVKNQDRTYQLNLDKFAETINQNKNNNSYRDMFFGYQKDKDNRNFLYQKGRDEVKDNQWENQFDFNTMQANKPKYSTFTGVDAQGSPVLSVFNQNDGTVQNTNSQVYQKPKEITPYQAENIRLREDAAKQKAMQQRLKAIETLSVADGWDDLTTEGQQQMIDYYNQTGLIPKIKNPWVGDATPIIPIQSNVNNTGFVNTSQNKPMPSLQEVNQSINAMDSIDTTHENKIYSNRNTRDLVKAREWAEGEGQKYLVDLWIPSDEEILQRYLRYGKGANPTFNNSSKKRTNTIPLTKEQEEELSRQIEENMKALMY